MSAEPSNDGSACPRCGTALTADELAGGCPRCLASALFTASSPLQATAPEVQVIRRLGDYELLEEVARGGMGIVYRARQVSLNRIVAVKLMRDSALAGVGEMKRFRVEAAAAARLKHPHIVAIHEVGEQDGQHWFAMDLVEGSDLARHTHQGPLPALEAARITATIAEAVQHAHEKGVLHRDLKPSNVLLDGQGQPFVTDFGLARSLDADSSLTVTGQVLGTPGYMPPEQAMGRGTVGPAADIYSLGAVLYHLLTGRAPFAGGTPAETMRHVVEQEPVSPQLLNPGVPRDLVSVCLKCLNKRPSDRYATAADLAEDLRRFLGGEPTLARPAGQTERLWRWCQRKPAIAALTVAVCLLVLLFAIGSPIVAYRMNLAREAAENLRSRAEAGETAARHNLYAADMNVAQQAWAESNFRRVRELLERHIPSAGEEDLRDFEWRHLWGLSRSDELFGFALASRPVQVVFSPNGKWFATASMWREAKVWDAATRREIGRVASSHAQLGLAFARDSSLLAVPTTNGMVHLWEMSAGRTRQILTNSEPIFCARFLDDNQTILLAETKYITIWKLGAEQPIRRFPVDPMNQFNSGFDVSPDGRQVATAGRGQAIRLWNLDDGSPTATLRGAGSGVHDIAYSHDGKYLAAAGDAGVRMWDLHNDAACLVLTNHSGSTYGLAFSPDSQQLATTGADQTVRLWKSGTSIEIATLRGHTHDIWSASYSPDNRSLVTGSRDGEIKFWNPNSASKPRPTLKAAASDCLSWGFSADVTRFVSIHQNGTIQFWDANSLEGTGEKTLRVSKPSLAAYSPQNNLVAFGRTDGTVQLADIASRSDETVTGFKTSPPLKWLEFSTDGSCLAAASEDSITIWNVATAKVEMQLAQQVAFFLYARPVALSPNGRILAAGSIDGSISIHDLRNGTMRSVHPENFANVRLMFSPDGKTLGILGADFAVALWDLETLHKVAKFQNVRSEPRFLAFSPNGRRLAIAGFQTIKLCDLRTRQEVSSFVAREGQRILGLAFSTDGNCLVAAVNKGFEFWWADSIPKTGLSKQEK